MSKKISFIITAILVLGMVFACQSAGDGKSASETTDIVVVGAGITGYAAAIKAKTDNPSLDVTILEKQGFVGGTTRTANGGWSIFVYDADQYANLQDFTAAYNTQYINLPGIINPDMVAPANRGVTMPNTGFPDYAKTYNVFRQAKMVVQDFFTNICDVVFEPRQGAGPKVTSPPGELGGSVLIDTLDAKAKSLGIKVYVECKAESIIMDNGRAVGVRANGGALTINAKKVILATGGFSMNPERVAAWAGNEPGLNYIQSFAAVGTTGEGIQMAFDAGGAAYESTFSNVCRLSYDVALLNVAGEAWYYWANGAPWPTHALPMEDLIIVNNEGNRIAAETIDGGTFAWWMVHENKGPYWVIFGDGQMSDAEEEALAAGVAAVPASVKTAASVSSIASAMGLNAQGAANLQNAITAWNASVAAGRDSVIPGKNMANARAISGNTYWAAKVFPNVWDSSGGVKTNDDGQVLKANGSVVPNLYAAGAVSNRAYFNQYYLGGTSLPTYSTTGYLAGKHAAAHIGD
jgi:fumarate reductase flavoprotein subunit